MSWVPRHSPRPDIVNCTRARNANCNVAEPSDRRCLAAGRPECVGKTDSPCRYVSSEWRWGCHILLKRRRLPLQRLRFGIRTLVVG